MIAWLASNWLAIVLVLVIAAVCALCIRELLPGRGKSSCAGCAGCSGGASPPCNSNNPSR